MSLARRVTLVLVGLLFSVLLASSSHADTFDISWSGPFGSGTGTITTTPGSIPGQDIISVLDATQAGLSLTLLAPFTYGNNDNVVIPGGSPLLHGDGFAFTDGSFDYNIFFSIDFNGYQECISSATNCSTIEDGVALTSFSITPATVGTPEPASLVLLGTGMLALFGSRRMKRFA